MSCVQKPCTVCDHAFTSGSVTFLRNDGLPSKIGRDWPSSSRPSPLKFWSTNWMICSSVMFAVLLPEEVTRSLNAERTCFEEPLVGLSTTVFGSENTLARLTVCNSCTNNEVTTSYVNQIGVLTEPAQKISLGHHGWVGGSGAWLGRSCVDETVADATAVESVSVGAGTDDPDSVTVPMTVASGWGKHVTRAAWTAKRTAANNALWSRMVNAGREAGDVGRVWGVGRRQRPVDSHFMHFYSWRLKQSMCGATPASPPHADAHCVRCVI